MKGEREGHKALGSVMCTGAYHSVHITMVQQSGGGQLRAMVFVLPTS